MSTITQSDQWLGVEVRHFAALDAVAREGSFGRAADRLGYTQSAVSQQIATLETARRRDAGRAAGRPPGRLADRGRQLLLRHAEAIVARLDAARADIAALRAGETGTLRDRHLPVDRRACPARRHAPLPRRLAGYRARALGAGDRSRSSSPRSSRASSTWRSAAARCPDGPFEAVDLMSDPYVLVVPGDSPLAERKLRLARRPRRARADRVEHVRERARGRGELPSGDHEIDYGFRSDDNGTVQGLVAAGFGVAADALARRRRPGTSAFGCSGSRPRCRAA